MRFYTVIFAYFRGLAEFLADFLPLTARSLAQYPRNLTDLSSWVHHTLMTWNASPFRLLYFYNIHRSNKFKYSPPASIDSSTVSTEADLANSGALFPPLPLLRFLPLTLVFGPFSASKLAS